MWSVESCLDVYHSFRYGINQRELKGITEEIVPYSLGMRQAACGNCVRDVVRTKKCQPALMSHCPLQVRQTWPGDWGKAFIPLGLVGFHLGYCVLDVGETVERCEETGAGLLEDCWHGQAVSSAAHWRLVDNLIAVCNYLKGNCKVYGTKLFFI